MNEHIKNVYLHVGYHKTATTSIQATLYRNREILEENNYFYPKDWQENHGFVFGPILHNEPEKFLTNIIANRNREQCLEINEQNINTIKREMMNTKCENVIFSGEEISVIREELVSKLIKFIRDLAPKAKINVIIFTRENLSFKTSAIQQGVKGGYSVQEGLDTTLVEIHKNKVEKFISVVGKDNIIICKFEDSIKHEYGPVGHFLSLIGLGHLIHKVNIIKDNEGMNNKSISIIDYINTKKPLIQNNEVVKGRFNGDILPLDRLTGSKYTLPVKCQKEILESSKSDKLWLKENTGIDYLSNDDSIKKPVDLIFDEVNEDELKSILLELSPLLLKLTYDYFIEKLKEGVDEVSRKTFENLIVFCNNMYIESKDESGEILIKKECSIPVSIIVPVYNVENYLEECLDSILKQKFENIEIIAVNDGSTDNSVDILNKYLIKDSRIKIVNQENGGLGNARNTGLNHASGEYIVYLDSDDFIEPNYISELYTKAKKDDLDVVITDFWLYYEDTEEYVEYRDETLFIFLKNKVFKAVDYPEVFKLIAAWDKMYKREFLLKNNIMTPEKIYYEDRPYTVETLLKADRVGVVNKKLLNYRKSNKTSITSSEVKNMKHKLDFIESMRQSLVVARAYEQYQTIMIPYLDDCIANSIFHHRNILDKGNKKVFFDKLRDVFEEKDYSLAKKSDNNLHKDYMETIKNNDISKCIEVLKY